MINTTVVFLRLCSFLIFVFDVAFIAFCHHKLFSVEIDGVIRFKACWVEQVELAGSTCIFARKRIIARYCVACGQPTDGFVATAQFVVRKRIPMYEHGIPHCLQLQCVFQLIFKNLNACAADV